MQLAHNIKNSHLLLDTIWLSFNFPCETNKGHNHSTVMMVYPPAKAHQASLLKYKYYHSN